MTDVTWAEEGAGRVTAAARRLAARKGADRRGGSAAGTVADLLGLHRAVLDAS